MRVYIVFEDKGYESEPVFNSLWASYEEAKEYVKGSSRWYVVMEPVLEGEEAKVAIKKRLATRG